MLTERLDGDDPTYVVEAGSAAGAEVLAAVPHRRAEAAETAAAADEVRAAASKMGRRMPDGDLRNLLVDSRESPHWSDVASRCLTCGNCTMVCPTCFCTSTSDVTDLTGEHAERWMEWASCFELDFTFVHEGPVRTSGPSRYRHWLTHKLSHLARPVRHLGVCRLRTVHRMVSHRHRHHRGDGHVRAAGGGPDDE